MNIPIDDRAPREITDDVAGCREAELRQLLAGCQERLQISVLKAALRTAILETHRVNIRCVNYDPAGSTYEADFSPEVRRWAVLCDLDLEQYTPSFFGRRI